MGIYTNVEFGLCNKIYKIYENGILKEIKTSATQMKIHITIVYLKNNYYDVTYYPQIPVNNTFYSKSYSSSQESDPWDNVDTVDISSSVTQNRYLNKSATFSNNQNILLQSNQQTDKIITFNNSQSSWKLQPVSI